MLHRFATAAALCMLIPMGATPLALADPADAGAPPPPPDNGLVASEVPGIAKTPDGRTLTVAAKDASQLPKAPLTTSLSSRDWVVGGTFTDTTTKTKTNRTQEAGYQFGCGVEMDKVK